MSAATNLAHRIASSLAARPAAPVAVLFIVGILLHERLPDQPARWLAAVVVLSALGLAVSSRTVVGSACIAAAVILAGAAAAQLAAFHYPRDHISAYLTDEPRLAQVELKIADTPRVLETDARQRPMPARQMMSGQVLRVKSWDGWVPGSGEVLLSVSPPNEELAAGQTVRAIGMLQRPTPAMNPGEFDWAKYYRRRRVLASLHVPHPYDVQIVKRGWTIGVPPLREAARRALGAGFSEANATEEAMLRALVFGDRTPPLHEVEKDFQSTGTSHLLASYGFCVATLAAAGYLACRLARVRPRTAVWVVCGLVALYGLLVVPSASAVRPILVAAAMAIGIVNRRSADSVQLLALAALVLLVGNPLDVYGAGFQIGFGVILGLVLLTKRFKEMLPAAIDADEQALRRLGRLAVGQRARTWARKSLIDALAAGVVAWLVSLPLVAYHFGQFNLWTVPASLLMAPLTLAALTAGLLKVALTLVAPPLAGAWATAAWAPAAALRHEVHWLAMLPARDAPLPTPSLGMIVLYYATLCLPLLRWTRPQLRWGMRCAPLGGCALLVLLPAGFSAQSTAAGEMRITLLSVGAGQCAVIETPDGKAALFDAGSATISDPLRTCIAPFLRQEGRSRIDSVFLSHGDFDHIGAAGQIVGAYGVTDIFTSPLFRRHAPQGTPAGALLEELASGRHWPRLIWSGNKLPIGGAELEVLWPPPGCEFNSNNTGLVVRLTYAGCSVLFPADIQDPAERELLKAPQKLRADVLVAPHHGSSESSTAEFIRAVNPSVILSSNDSTLTVKQRVFETIVEQRPLYRTHVYGALTVRIARDGTVRIEPFRGAGVTLPAPNAAAR